MTHTVRITSPYARERAAAMCLRAPEGFTMTLRAPTRTTAQNAKMWAMLTDISRAKPDGRKHTPEVWKAIFMQGMGHQQHFEEDLDGRPFPLGYRSSRMTVGQMSDFIEFVYATCAQKGWRIDWTDGEAVA